MTMLAEVIDAVIGIDTHRDSHEVEIADPAGKPIAAMRIGNDSAGFTQLLAAIAETAPGPRVAVSVEGTRSCPLSSCCGRSPGSPPWGSPGTGSAPSTCR
jgi:transposase